MEKRNIIAIGASTGGFEALKKIVGALPADIGAAIFIVWHMAPTIKSLLPEVLNKVNKIPAAHAMDGEPISMNRIYVAPPDRHMLIENGHIRVTNGPKENRFRPAVDPLFRSAAYFFENRVIGIILSGGLDDGTSGLWNIKYRGGITIAQDPNDSEVPSMPASAIREVAMDHVLPASEIGSLLAELVRQPPVVMKHASSFENEKTEAEIRIAADNSEGIYIMNYGQLSPLSCPECHGVLTLLQDGSISRFRCHTGHAYTAEGLFAAVTDKMEESLYSALRGVDESIMLLNHLGDHFAEANYPTLAARYFRHAQRASRRSKVLRQVLLMGTELEDNEELPSDF